MVYTESDKVVQFLCQYLHRLQIIDKHQRHVIAQEFRTCILTLSRQLKSETLSKVYHHFVPHLNISLLSTNIADQWGALTAIEILIDLVTEDQIIQFANYIRYALVQKNISSDILRRMSEIIGRLANAHQTNINGVSGTLVSAYVEFEVQRAFEWLQNGATPTMFIRPRPSSNLPITRHSSMELSSNKNIKSNTGPYGKGYDPQRRLAACLVLKELCEAAPTLFHNKIGVFFQWIWSCVHDDHIDIRIAAGEAMRVTLQLIHYRQTRHRVQWYCKVYEYVVSTLSVRTVSQTNSTEMENKKNGNTDVSSTSNQVSLAGPISWNAIHGSLIVIGELVSNTEGFMMPRYREVCELVLSYKDTKHNLVRQTVTRLLPRLARYCPGAFVRYYLGTAVVHLQKRIESVVLSPLERGLSFESLGLIALAVGEHMLPYVKPLLSLMKEAVVPFLFPTKMTHHTVLHHATSGPLLLGGGAIKPSNTVSGTGSGLVGVSAPSSHNTVKKRNKLFCKEAWPCVANFATALGPSIELECMELVELMMNSDGLRVDLTDALAQIISAIPRCLPMVQERLLHDVSMNLRGIPFLWTSTPALDNENNILPRNNTTESVSNRGGTFNSATSSSPNFVPSPSARLQSNFALASTNPVEINPNWIAMSNPISSFLSSMFSLTSSNDEKGYLNDELEGDTLMFSLGLTGAARLNLPLSNKVANGQRSTSVTSLAPHYNVIKGKTVEERESILLSLRTLRNFDFRGTWCLLPFVRDCVSQFLMHPDPSIRQQTVVTCLKLLPLAHSTPVVEVMGGMKHEKSMHGVYLAKRGPSSRVIDDLLTRILQVGVSDPDHRVRLSVVDTLLSDEDESTHKTETQFRLDATLSQQMHLQLMLLFLNDEVSSIREQAMKLLSRLAPQNPAIVLPCFRQLLIQLLTELQHTTPDDTSKREQSTMLLGHLVKGAGQRLIDPYVGRILAVLLPLIVQSSNVALVHTVLQTLGEVSLVAYEEVSHYEQYVFPLIIHTLLPDHGIVEKQTVALQTLGKVAGSTGSVVSPYLAFPKLLERLVSLLRHTTTTPWLLRQEAMKTIGILGALDPYKYRLCVSGRYIADTVRNELGKWTNNDKIEDTGLNSRGKVSTHLARLQLEFDLKDLGIPSDLLNIPSLKHLGNLLDDKQHIELQLFTAAPIGTRRSSQQIKKMASNADGEDSLTAMTTGIAAPPATDEATGEAKSAAGGNNDRLDGNLNAIDGFKVSGYGIESLLPAEYVGMKDLDPTSVSPTSEVYFPTVAIAALLQILKEDSLSAHHHGGVQAIMLIIKSGTNQCVQFLPHIVPRVLHMAMSCEPLLRDSLFVHLTTLVALMKNHMKPFFPAMIGLSLKWWMPHCVHILPMIEQMSSISPREFQMKWFPKILPKVLDILQPSTSPSVFDVLANATERKFGQARVSSNGLRLVNNVDFNLKGHLQTPNSIKSQNLENSDLASVLGIASNRLSETDSAYLLAIQHQIVNSLVVFGEAVAEYVYLLIPALVRLLEHQETPVSLVSRIVCAMARMCVVSKFEHYAGGRLLHPLARLTIRIWKTLVPSGVLGKGIGQKANISNGKNKPLSGVDPSQSDLQTFLVSLLYMLCAIAYQLQHDLLSFEPLVAAILNCINDLNQHVDSMPNRSGATSIMNDHDAVLGNGPTSSRRISGVAIEGSSLTGNSKIALIMQLIQNALQNLRAGEMISISVLENPLFKTSTIWTLVNSTAASNTGNIANSGLPLRGTIVGSIIATGSTTSLHINQQNLSRAWEVSQRSTKDDWMEWLPRFSIELLRESPSPALRACCALAQAYPPLTRRLMNPAFASCWSELHEDYKKSLVAALETAFQSTTIPAEIIQTLLNLAEFMEHDVEALPIDIRELGELAQKCHGYAKALHYKELEFHSSPSTCIEALISINNQLGQPEAAVGILNYARCHHGSTIQVQETWFEKLGDWEAALSLYNEKLGHLGILSGPHGTTDSNPAANVAIDLCIGKMRCLEALGEWEQVADMCHRVFNYLNAVDSINDSASLRNGSKSLPRITRGTNAGNDNQDVEAQIQNVAMVGARAAWCLSQWDDMQTYVDTFRENVDTAHHAITPSDFLHSASLKADVSNSTDRFLYQAVLAVHHSRFEDAITLIEATRRTLDFKLGALVTESYHRAYPSIVTLQQLSELEEIMEYKKLEIQHEIKSSPGDVPNYIPVENPAKKYKSRLMQMWRLRLQGCKQTPEVWQQLLAGRSLIVSPHEDVETWLQFASLCRQSGKLALSFKIFTSVLGMKGVSNGSLEDTQTQSYLPMHGSPSVLSTSNSILYSEKETHRMTFAYLKHLWATGDQQIALKELQVLVMKLTSRCRISIAANHATAGNPTLSQSNMRSFNPNISAMEIPVPHAHQVPQKDDEELLVKCHLKSAQWQLAIHDQQLIEVEITRVLDALQVCTALQPHSYKAWHAWALMNFHVVDHHLQSRDSKTNAALPSKLTSEQLGSHIAAAIDGFFRSIALGRSRWAAHVQQDILRVLTLWFAHGSRPNVIVALQRGFAMVPIETWLIVIPQLIARIHTKVPQIQKQLHQLLIDIGESHPHALMYPLSVALKSQLLERQSAAEAIMVTMREKYSGLVDEALVVSRELIRIAILWNEMWHEKLEEASKLWFTDHNAEGMVAVLAPLHTMMEEGPETLREASFQQVYGRELQEAKEWMNRFIESKTNNAPNEAYINRAWDLYYHVFRRINKQLPQVTTLELHYVSPKLFQTTQATFQLAIPGTYRVGHPIIRISRFVSTIQVIPSKQRPRRIGMIGSNGLQYQFLLKGHEDLRQDERATQLFGLVNALLINDRVTAKKELRIHRYPVIPLSHNAGIVGWVPDCDTFHQLIREYRDARKILLNIEHRLMLQMAPDYESLTLIQKVEVFKYALENTAGQDLYKVLWLKSENSEIWLDRRTNYTRSLAVMSMVGYILGLGDRHPSNLMLHRFSGTVVHIDFGDCFDVAMDRAKYPEKVPFRLTRMLINAMEVSGIEGTFKFSCERVMKVLRENRQSLMAMLEAFVHDPLINWRLLHGEDHNNVEGSGQTGVSEQSVATSLKVASKVENKAFSPHDAGLTTITEQDTPGIPQDEDNIDLEIQTLDAIEEESGEDEADEEDDDDEQNIDSADEEDDFDDHINELPSTSARNLSQSFRPQSLSRSIPIDIQLRPNLFNEAQHPAVAQSLHQTSNENRNVKITRFTTQHLGGHSLPGKLHVSSTITDHFDRPSQLNYGNVNIQEEISSLAASVNSVGHASLRRNFEIHSRQSSLPTSGGDTQNDYDEAESDVSSDLESLLENLSVEKLPSATIASVKQSYYSTIDPSLEIFEPEVESSQSQTNLATEMFPGRSTTALNEKAVEVIKRVQAKLTGRDFGEENKSGRSSRQEPLDVSAQVDLLISQAASHENLCQCYIGWCPFW